MIVNVRTAEWVDGVETERVHRLVAKAASVWSIHCSHCDKEYVEPDVGATYWRLEQLIELGKWGVEEYGWHLNVKGRGLVCDDCYDKGTCEECDGTLRAWDAIMIDIESGKRTHAMCHKMIWRFDDE